ncbi:hypothetical protein HKX48_007387 [Thoreauomyces humboldtii]|nr:hypothetical protein HKX48_007387 [Thoreauomyces humboldtii]
MPSKMVVQSRSSGRLNLSNQNLTEIPEALWEEDLGETTQKRRTPDYSFDKVDDGGANWWEVVDLVRLVIADNALQTVDPRVGGFQALALLDLRNNMLTSLPDELCDLLNLSILNVSGNALQTLPEGIYGLPITELNLSYNKFTTLPEQLGAMRRLATLDASHNALTSLPLSLTQCRALTHLNVAKNALSRLVEASGSTIIFPTLMDLDANGNVLSHLFGDAAELPALQRLDLRHNKLRMFPPEKGLNLTLTVVKEMYLSHNFIGSLGDDVLRPAEEQLQTLDIGNNELNLFPVSILRCIQLKRLDISNNNISKLPPQLGNLETINTFLFVGNPLRGIPTGPTSRVLALLRDRIVDTTPEIASATTSRSTTPSRSTITSAAQSRASSPGGSTSSSSAASLVRASAQESATRTVDLSHKSLNDDVDPAAFTTVAFDPSSLLLHHNAFTRAPVAAIAQLAASLTTLVLSHNRIMEFPHLLDLPELRYLDLSSNLLSSFPNQTNPTDPSRLPSLVELNVSRNRIVALPDRFPFPNLEALLVTGNSLTALDPETLIAMSNLSVLDVADNDIKQINPRIALTPKLRVLRIAGNSFRVPRRDIVERGTDAILEYLRDRIPVY